MLKKRREFLRTYKTRPIVGKFFKIYAISNKEKSNRLGVTIPKAVSNAVIRNKYKRWIKEVFKNFKNQKNGGFYDIHVFIPPKTNNSEKIKWEQFQHELSEKLKKIIESEA